MADAIQADIDKLKPSLTWLQRHERLVLALIVAVTVLCIGNRWLNNSAARDKQASVAASENLAAQKQANAQLAAQVADSTSKYQALLASATQQNAQLAAAAQSRTVVLQAQQAKDSTLDSAGVAARLTALEKLQAGQVTASAGPDGALSVSKSSGQQIASDLDSVAPLKANLADAQTALANANGALAGANTVIAGLQDEVLGLKKQLADADSSFNATIASLKAEDRKSKWNWFLRGLGIGIGLVTTAIAVFFK